LVSGTAACGFCRNGKAARSVKGFRSPFTLSCRRAIQGQLLLRSASTIFLSVYVVEDSGEPDSQFGKWLGKCQHVLRMMDHESYNLLSYIWIHIYCRYDRLPENGCAPDIRYDQIFAKRDDTIPSDAVSCVA